MFAGKRKNFFCKTDFFLIYCTRWERLPIGQEKTARSRRSLFPGLHNKMQKYYNEFGGQSDFTKLFSTFSQRRLFGGPKQALEPEGESLLLKNGSLALKSESPALKSQFNWVIYQCLTCACINAFIWRKNVSILHRRNVTR